MGTRIKDRLEDAFDVNFDVSEIKIDTFDDFGRVLLEPYNGGEKLYYRGERIKSRTRRLIPTLLRNEDVIEEMNGGSIFNIDSKKLFDFYCSRKHFYIGIQNSLRRTVGEQYVLYDGICAALP